MSKRCISILAVAAVLCAVVLLPAGAAAFMQRCGDVDGDGTIGLKDVTLLRRLIADGEETSASGNPDADGDGAVTLKDVTRLRRYLAGGWDVELPEDNRSPLPEDLRQYKVLSSADCANGINGVSFSYGQSVLGRELVCWCISPEHYTRTVFLNFAIHGWEDEYAADGRVLSDLGEALAAHYSRNGGLGACRLLIVPCANPDGIAEGITNDGFGRCNADGIDLNRDFDAEHKVYTNDRNYTPAPFSGKESRALRDLVLAAKPDVVLDLHGWLNYTIGSGELAEVFSLEVGLNHRRELGEGTNGYFTYWAQLQGAEALLVEFRNPESVVTEDVIAAVDRLLADNYGAKQRDYELDRDFASFASVETFALNAGRVYTQKTVGGSGTDYGYIDGAADVCTVLQIYANGWCKVRYPANGLTKTGYCPVSAFIDPELEVSHYGANVSKTEAVYATPAMTAQIGKVWASDRFTVIAEMNGAAQIIFPLDGGGYKMGWIEMRLISNES